MSGQQPPFELPPSPCPADHVQSVEPGSPSGVPSHGQGLGDFQIQLLSALIAQTSALNRLAQSNEMLVQAMAEDAGMDEDRPVSQYLDGSPVR